MPGKDLLETDFKNTHSYPRVIQNDGFISCIVFIHGDLFLSKTVADIHTDGSQNSPYLLLFLTLAVHNTALNIGAFDSSSLLKVFLAGRSWAAWSL